MKSRATRWVLCGLVGLGLAFAAAGQEQYPPLAVPAREVPVPDTVSPELQKQIAKPFSAPAKLPTTDEEWKEFQRESDEARGKEAQMLAEQAGAKVEPVKVGGVNCYRVTPKEVARGKENFLLVHVHGGAFVLLGGYAAIGEAVLLADACKMPVLSIDYRRPPDHRFPAAPDDVLAVWKALVKDRDPKKVVMGGTSAGGGLIMTTMLRCKVDKVSMPAALFLGTPAAELSKTGDSAFLNAEVDNCLGRYEGFVEACVKLYAGDKKNNLKEPYLSPVYGDMAGWPPAVLITGTRDLVLSPTIRTHRKLRAAGVTAELHVYEGQSHADYLNAPSAPESKDALREVAAFFDRYLVK